MKACLLLLAALTFLTGMPRAETVWGDTYPVIELDLAQLLRENVRDAQNAGRFREELDKNRKRLQNHAQNPIELNLPASQEIRVVDRSLIAEETWRQIDNNLQKQIKAIRRLYVFFDANQPEQLAAVGVLMAKKELRAVAVGGNLLKAQDELSARIWADQGGVLTRRFGLETVPALVAIAGTSARIVTFASDKALQALDFISEEAP